MTSLRETLMIRESMERLGAAEVLRSGGDTSDSGYLLRLLAFELLLKVLVERDTANKAPGIHFYDQLFDRLSPESQTQLLAGAANWIGPSDLTTNHRLVLSQLGRNFVALRYPYDKYDGMSADEYAAVGNDWIKQGAPVEHATFRYFPEELYGLIRAAQELVGV
jgi:hypothetical protein